MKKDTILSFIAVLILTGGIVFASQFSPQQFSGTLSYPSYGGTGTSTNPTDNQILIGNTTNARYDVKTLTAGSNITISNSGGAVTISSTGGSGSVVGTISTSSPPIIGQIPYWTDTGYPSKLGSVATSSPVATYPIQISGAGYVIGSAITISTAISTSTGDWGGTFDGQEGSYYLNASNLTNFNIPFNSNLGTATSTITCAGSVSCGAGAYVVGSALNITGTGLTSYDAFTHPSVGQSATTSLMVLNGNASTTQLTVSGNTYLPLTGILKGNGAGNALTVATNGTDFTLTTAQTCTNQVITALTASGGSTCSSVSDAMLASTFLKTIGSGTNGNLAYWTGANTLTSIATTTPTFGLGLTLGGTWYVLGSLPTLNLATSSLFTGSTGQLAYFSGTNAISGVSSLTALTITNASSTAFSSAYASSTSLYAANAYLPLLGTAAGTYLAVDSTGKIIATTTPVVNVGGYMTKTGNTVSLHSELYTDCPWTASYGSSTMATTTGTFLQKAVGVAWTITSIKFWTDTGTSTFQVEERDGANPNAVGTDMLFAGGLQGGSGSGLTASSTIANNSLDAGDVMNIEIIDASPVGGVKPVKFYWSICGTKND